MNKTRKKPDTTSNPRSTVHGMSLREENIGKKRVDVNSMLRMEHLQKLATWASMEACVPLSALFGYRLATATEAEGVPLDPSTFVCHRCESILKPGVNCTVRIEKNVKKAKRKKKKKRQTPPQNNVVYKCHFCCHPNALRATQKGYVKGLLAPPSLPKPQPSSNIQLSSREVTSNPERRLDQKRLDAVASESSPLTPLDRLTNSAKKRKRKSNGTAPPPNSTPSNGRNSLAGSSVNSLEATVSSRKWKRKGWSSLRDIAERNEAMWSQSIASFAIPFNLQPAK